VCGICGFLGNCEGKFKTVEKMMNRIAHRGPDDFGFFVDERIAMGFRRLSFVDLKNGGQPIYSENKNLVLTFNGEIYNYKKLREELVSAGHVFSTETDSETILHGFEEWGTDVTLRLRGMFAFVIWNREKKELFLARDSFGIKPLYYCVCGNNFIYASEIKSILVFSGLKKKLNHSALDKYLSFQYCPPPETFFEGVFCLEAGHYAIFHKEDIKITKYFVPKFAPEKDTNIRRTCEKIKEVIRDSVEIHKVSDVEIGCFLSSGMDSSLLASYFPGGKSFTVGFDEGEKYNEIGWAKHFSEFAGTKNISKIISAKEFWDEILPVQYYMDQPLADPSCIALYFVCRLAREHVKAVVSGEGADELFGGYPSYNEPDVFNIYRKLPQKFRTFLAKIVRRIPFNFKGRGYIIRGEFSPEKKFIGNANIFSLKEKRRILKDPTEATDAVDFVKKFYEEAKGLDDVAKMQYIDTNLWLVGDILLKADRMSMANSLEVRVPFLDKEVFSIASKLPKNFKTRGGVTKFALRLAASPRLPPETTKKPKLGFPVPIRVWLRDEKYYKEVEKAFTSKIADKFFNINEILKLLNEHYCGKWDNSRKIWTVYVFIVWYDIYLADCD
jgi:asparagine synthase (glutamine-hydrolysing)